MNKVLMAWSTMRSMLRNIAAKSGAILAAGDCFGFGIGSALTVAESGYDVRLARVDQR